MPDADTALHATSLQKSHETIVALDDVSVAVARGSCTALAGESGFGKTTPLRTFNLMVKPGRGSVTVVGMLVGQTDDVTAAPIDRLCPTGRRPSPSLARAAHCRPRSLAEWHARCTGALTRCAPIGRATTR